MIILFGKILKTLRTNKGMTQAELGARLNISKVSISKYESGNQFPDTDTLKRIADIFNVSTDFLLGREETIPRNLAFDDLQGLTEDDLSKVNKYIALIKKQRQELEAIEKEL
ncbi:helix-turn-helix domain-containing protein [Listeria monocytogenes]|uniref:helix-turn-helix domain-containing protein n=1 Tax=Listeria monocytogenes TaxID=1639 RepID=UPI00215A723F|nr:helix-turn-helix transcriptional regulator [Listeria monocytogenes]